MNIKPLGNRLLVKQVEEKEQIKGGIIIPDAAKEKSQEATVVALGTGGRDEQGHEITFEVKVGDRVLISKYGGTEVKYDNETYMLLRQDDVMAVFSCCGGSSCSA
jgi:chaperonin GroES